MKLYEVRYIFITGSLFVRLKFLLPAHDERPLQPPQPRSFQSRGFVSTAPKTEEEKDLRPTNLSTKASEFKNDPLWQDFEAEGIEGLVAYASRRTFTVSFEGLQPLIEQTYDTMNSADRQFAKNVSRSAFSYYVWIHTYAHCIAIKKHKGDQTSQEDRFLEFLRNANFPLPAVIEEYLRGVGDVKDPIAVDYRIKFPSWPNRNGTFGVMTAENFHDYMAMAAPLVLAERIIADMRYTNQQNEANRNWNLSEAMRPQEVTAGLPTKNCLGWSQATILTPEQQRLLESAGVDIQGLHPTVTNFQLNRPLFEKVSDFLLIAEKTTKLGASVHESEKGSQAQILWQIRDDTQELGFSRNDQYGEANVSQRCFSFMDRRFTIASMITTYRSRKEAMKDGTRPYAPYDFNDYTEVPNTWHQNRNRTYTYGDVEIWNLSTYRTGFTIKSASRQTWVRKIIKDKSRD